ncbi:MAG TPA: BolA family protein [Aliidongia sp.]|nr:BolA family protein [Aliidongia sp.]
MKVAETIEAKLTAALQPHSLKIVDESARHAGHAGAAPGGETHFQVSIVSDAFAGHTRVARQRMVYAILSAEIQGGVHALSLSTLTPNELKDRKL